MSKRFRVLDCTFQEGVVEEHVCAATTPESAALAALGIELVRSGRKQDLRAKVYFQDAKGIVTMVRLYIPPAERH